ncbi:glutamate-1-semialdehyde-2,1-aminomutase [Rhizobium sp. SJZ105]|uniref:glutamate-1-semialdehyde 2,1-aminomutase n=1 Tax=Rhizobium sp. SJZ105 TaxID=2572678 RepID=UPI0011A4F1FD|nr:glutamate-1-semialdehyde 2,1-aminomutase [Rhizobium sp. SJZ105]TWC76342.1 glutamate-1-semialdehyde-2,1-aminomutase [Rhizobium sp. SJZ105]
MLICGPQVQYTTTTLFSAVREQCDRAPNAVAIVDAAGHLSYKELLGHVLAARDLLKEEGVAPGEPVILQSTRTRSSLVVLLAIFSVGAIAVPVSPFEAQNRVQHVARQVQARWHVSFKSKVAHDAEDQASIVLQSLAQEPPSEMKFYDRSGVAYILFTSGSSGVPKGVPITHEALSHYGKALSKLYLMAADDRVLAYALPSFDVSFQELSLAFMNGGALVLPSERQRKDPAELAKLMDLTGVTVCELPQSIFFRVGEHLNKKLRLISFGGEPISRRAINIGIGHSQLVFNGYGPTEATIAATQKMFVEEIEEAPSLGKPIDNHCIGIFDAQGNLAEANATGEIGISGPGVFDGYIGGDEARFVLAPVGGTTQRFYLTGDFGRISDGEVVFLGRRDGQVKIDGHRIELGEIESVLQTHPDVERAVVTAAASSSRMQLKATLQTGASAPIDGYWDFMRKRLPWNMIPREVNYVSNIGLNPNGKTVKRSSGMAKPEEKLLAEPGFEDLQQRAEHVIPLGVSSPLRACKNVHSNPLFVEKAQGELLYCTDGQTYRDFLYGFGPVILGHSHPSVVRAIRSTSENVQVTATGSAIELELAERLCASASHLEQVRFVNSGTEAVMSAVRLAKAFTGRTSVVRMRGGYHGHADSVQDAVQEEALRRGIDPRAQDTNILVDVNDISQIRAVAAEHGTKIACILIEPIMCNATILKPSSEYLHGLRQICDEIGALLVYDEVITGFRFNYGPVNHIPEVKPDLTIFGKIIGGGLPVGAYGGGREIMKLLTTQQVYQGGTFSGNPVVMSAGLAVLNELETGTVYAEIAQKASYFWNGLVGELGEKKAAESVCLHGGVFSFKLTGTEDDIRSEHDLNTQDRSLYTTIYQKARKKHIHLAPDIVECNYLTPATSEKAMSDLIEVIGESVKR